MLPEYTICLDKFKKLLCIEETDIEMIKEYKEKRLNHV